MLGHRKQPEPDEAKSEPEDAQPGRALTFEEEVFARRYLRLIALRVDPEDALRLIEIPDVAHQAEQLHAKGCPPDLIARILER